MWMADVFFDQCEVKSPHETCLVWAKPSNTEEKAQVELHVLYT